MKADSNLDFAGQGGVGYSRGSNKYAGNQSGETMKGNYGMGPRKGNTDTRIVPNPTAKSGKINGGATVKCPTNPDKINAGQGPRKGNK